MKLNQTERDEIELLIGQMNTMSKNYATSESNDCRYVAYYMGKYAETLSRLLNGYYDFETGEASREACDAHV